MKRIGITTTVPVEVIFASGNTPVDLNNIFITHSNPHGFIERAEQKGFPRNICAWIKAIYSAALEAGVDAVIGVCEGDCSNTTALLEVLREDGVEIYEFGFPRDRSKEELQKNIDGLARALGAKQRDIEKVRANLKGIREKLRYLDRLTIDGKATGFENHLWQVSASDFNGDYIQFEIDLDKKLLEIEKRTPRDIKVRLGYMGVPPIIGDLYSVVEDLGGAIVFNEVQRQFTIADGVDMDLADSYLNFTYPYSLEGRLGDISKEIEQRSIDGIIHYTQAFCYRAIEDIVIRKKLKVPVLKLEGDKPDNVDGRSKLRLEAFIDMLKDMER